jgi:metal-responsive CopG/Arc/MetJ family transcriptional regulator
MNRNTIRLNITLPKSLVTSLDEVAGLRKRSQFIADAVQERIEQIKNAEMSALLKEGYQIHQAESIAIVKDFEGLAEAENPGNENQQG